MAQGSSAVTVPARLAARTERGESALATELAPWKRLATAWSVACNGSFKELGASKRFLLSKLVVKESEIRWELVKSRLMLNLRSGDRFPDLAPFQIALKPNKLIRSIQRYISLQTVPDSSNLAARKNSKGCSGFDFVSGLTQTDHDVEKTIATLSIKISASLAFLL
jgi:hypothetical protein